MKGFSPTKKLKKVKIAIIVAACLIILSGIFLLFLNAEHMKREFKSCQSDLGGGLYREINIYTPTGELIAHYEGKVDIEENESGGKVLFDLDGKRYIYYNCLVEVIEIDEPRN